MNSAWCWGSPAGVSRPRTSSCFATTTFHRCWWKPPSSRTPTTSCGCATRLSASTWRRPCTTASSGSLPSTPCPSRRLDSERCHLRSSRETTSRLMKLTILGKWSPYPPAGGACPGYLVEADGVRILVDCGSGVVSSLHRFGTAFDLNAIVISHLHPDHFTDIYPLRNELAYGRLPDPPPTPVLLFAPAGAAGYLAACLPKPESRQEFTAGFTFRALEDGVGNAGGVRLRVVLTSHPMPRHGGEVSAGGRRLVYSADTGPCEALERPAAGGGLVPLGSTPMGGGEQTSGHVGHPPR